MQTVFLSSVPLKAVRKFPFQIFEIIWPHSLITRNETVCIMRIRGMNLFEYGEYTECSHTENMQNESVRIMRMLGMNLCVY